jgi:NAD(P)H-hydrate epimerase
MRLPTLLRQRKPESHKGDYGHVLVIGGCLEYSGAPVLCAEAALRAGAGLVTIGIPRSLCSPAIRIKPKEIKLLPLPETKKSGIAGQRRGKDRLVQQKSRRDRTGPGASTTFRSKAVRTFNVRNIPMVIDADGLNALAGHTGLLRNRNRKAPIIITPHTGEMSRLSDIPCETIEKNRKKVAKTFATDYNITTVLKGRKTLVISPDGETYTNDTGNPGMATAGSGDVLTGIVAAFLGQGLDSFAAAKYAVYIHGLAGDLAAVEIGQISLTASDIVRFLPQAIKKCY